MYSMLGMLLMGGMPSIIMAQSEGYSGSDINNYQCPTSQIRTNCSGPSEQNGVFVCKCQETIYGVPKTVTVNAIPKPPQLRVISYWFVRVLYGVWAFSGIVFMFILVALGFRYMTSFGNEVAVADVIKRFRWWMIGIVLVFLSYPILNTVFNLIGLSDDECFRDIQMPAFEVFFPSACVAN